MESLDECDKYGITCNGNDVITKVDLGECLYALLLQVLINFLLIFL